MRHLKKCRIFFVYTMKKTLNLYSEYLREKFGQRIQKIPLYSGATCPNRDGSKGYGGCTFCNNDAFMPTYTRIEPTLTEQLNKGLTFFREKYETNLFIAYFQSYTSTFTAIEHFKNQVYECLQHQDIKGITIGTRPDCMPDELLEFLTEISKKTYLCIEYGAESIYENCLKTTNRCHTWQESVETITKTAEKGIETGVHLIFGLPEEPENIAIETAETISKLPIYLLKLHQLQILKGTTMGHHFLKKENAIKTMTLDEYIKITTTFLEHLNPSILIDRLSTESPVDMVLAPHWGGVRHYEVKHKIESELKRRNSWQGKFWNNHSQ